MWMPQGLAALRDGRLSDREETSVEVEWMFGGSIVMYVLTTAVLILLSQSEGRGAAVSALLYGVLLTAFIWLPLIMWMLALLSKKGEGRKAERLST